VVDINSRTESYQNKWLQYLGRSEQNKFLNYLQTTSPEAEETKDAQVND
jgi:hypothetical protein